MSDDDKYHPKDLGITEQTIECDEEVDQPMLLAESQKHIVV